MAKNSACFLWLDLEMTGLEPEVCAIVEVAAIITGPDLESREEFERVVWQPEEVLARMEPIVREMHSKSGLTERIRASPYSLRETERDLFDLAAKHCGPGEGILAGNTIHHDRRFLARYMPLVERYLSYRQVDVSSLKLLTRAWYPDSPSFQKPESNHRALADIRGSIAELRHYRETYFRANPG
jgi:oligoribonuclease